MTIQRIDAEPIEGRIRSEIAIVSSLATHRTGQYVLVRVHDDSGHVGLGEASVTSVWSGETQAGVIALFREVLAPLVVGADPFDDVWVMRRIERIAFGNSFAKAALEMALLDLQGRILNRPLYQLLGGQDTSSNDTPQGIRLKFVIGAVEPEIAAQRARRMVDQGWTAIKVKVGRQGDPRIDLNRLRAVREAIGPGVFLSIDANGGFSVEQAIWLAQRIEALDVALFEQPTQRGNHLAMAGVRRRSPVPIMADESVFTLADTLAIIQAEAADILSIYPGKHGGIRESQTIARIAEAAGLACTIGSNLEREVATSAMAHLVRATPNVKCERFPGDLIGPLYYEQALTRAPLEYRADRLMQPAAAGLGVEVAETGA